MKWFLSDVHFNHKKVIEYCDRPYTSVEEMNNAIIDSWNKYINPTDEVYFIGDFGINKQEVFNTDILNKLNGEKHIILGNHDFGFSRLHCNKNIEQINNKYLKAGWKSVQVIKHLKLNNEYNVICAHLPPNNNFDTRYSDYKLQNNSTQFYLNGHLHGHYRKFNNMIDVGWDIDFKPISENDIIDIINDKRDFIPTRLTEKYKKEKMNNKLDAYEKEVKKGNIRKVEHEGLVLYNYTDQCTFDRAWNNETLSARGIIFEKETGEVVARPFPKFFNIGEMAETRLENLPDEPYTVTEKEDGSLGIIYKYKGKWNVATRGSFNSVQAQRAAQILEEYNMDIDPLLTLLVEIIYPENKIVVNYNGEEKLILLGIIDSFTGKELSYEAVQRIGRITGMPVVERYNYTIDEMIDLQATLPKDKEGFVVRYESGLRVKIKGSEYLKIHKMISNISPISFWEAMKDGSVRIDYLKELPEEYRKDAEELKDVLESKYDETWAEAFDDYYTVMKQVKKLKLTRQDLKKQVGLYVQENDLKHKSAVFSIFNRKFDLLDKYVMRQIRPNGNVLT